MRTILTDHLRRVICIIASSLLLVLLAGCGVPDQRTGQPAAAPAAQSQSATPEPTFDAAYYVTHPELWPTRSPAMQTQAALIAGVATAVANVAATNQALPPAPQDDPLPVYPTATPQPTGILNCQDVDRERQFATWNCWRAETSTQYIMVRAGGESGVVRKVGDPSRYREDDPTIRGGVKVCTAPRSDRNASTCDVYWRSEREGRLKIVAAEGMRLTLEAVTGSRYVFNVETRQWEAAPAIPVPTATPLPTAVPLPTFTLLPTSTAGSTPTSTPTPNAAAPPAIIVRYPPTINGSVQITGDVQQLLGEDLTLNSGVIITGDLRLPGRPIISRNEPVTLGATVTGSGSSEPSGYRLTLNSGVQLSRLVTQTDPLALPSVAAPPQPTGTRDVTLTQPGESFGDPATLRNLSLNSNVGAAAVPPGAYGQFMVNDGSTLVLGVAGASQPAAYNLQALTLNGSGGIRLAGPVTLTLASGLTWSGRVGSPEHPDWLTLQVASGSVTLNSGAAFSGTLQAPTSTLALNGTNMLRGALRVDRLMLNAGSRIEAGSSTS